MPPLCFLLPLPLPPPLPLFLHALGTESEGEGGRERGRQPRLVVVDLGLDLGLVPNSVPGTYKTNMWYMFMHSYT